MQPRRDVGGQVALRIAGHQFVDAESLAREHESGGQPEARIKIRVHRPLEAVDAHAEFGDQAEGRAAPAGLRRLHRFAAAIADQQASVDLEFVAAGMSAEVIVIVENQNARGGARLVHEIRRREAADAGAHHREIDLLAHRIVVDAVFRPVSKRVRDGIIRFAAAAESGERRRIGRARCAANQIRIDRSGDHRACDTVDEVASGDLTWHWASHPDRRSPTAWCSRPYPNAPSNPSESSRPRPDPPPPRCRRRR